MNYSKKCDYQNGERRPLKGASKEIWDLLDSYNTDIPTLAEIEEMTKHKYNTETLRVRYCSYLRFHGISYTRGDIKRGRRFKIEF